MGFYIVNLMLSFYSRKIFLDYLGEEILGLNTTATNLLQLLNIAELGISQGISFMLYKPIYDKDQIRINEIITLQGQLYRRIALIVVIGGVVLMCFFPLIFKKITIPLWYSYASFGVMLFSSLLGYFFNYKQIILTANQQDYKVLYSYKSVMIIKVLIQMIAVKHFVNGYDWWLFLEILFAIIASISLHIMTRRSFPLIKSASIPFHVLRCKYHDFTVKVKQLFVHKIGGLVLTQSSPLIIYAYTTLSVVALYGNYLVIIAGIQLLLSSLFNSVNSSVGNLVAENNIKNTLNVFYELFSLRFFIVVVTCYCAYILVPDFIKLWIGEKYLLSQSTLIIIIISLYFNAIRVVVDSFIFAYGLYSDIWAPLIEAALNIGLSIVFGAFLGLNGVLLGGMISSILVISCWKPYFLFSKRFYGEFNNYITIYFRHIISAIIAIIVLQYLDFFYHIECLNWRNLIFKSLILVITSSSILFLCMYIFKTSILIVLKRILSLKRF